MTKDDLYHANDYATLTVNNEAGTETVVAGLKGVSIIPSHEMGRFYTADSNKIVDQIQYEDEVAVEIEFAFWDGDFAAEWLGGSGSTGTSWTDTTDPELFQIASYNHPSRNDANQIDITVDNVTFGEIPLIEWEEGEYVTWDLSGIGEDVSNYDVTAPA